MRAGPRAGIGLVRRALDMLVIDLESLTRAYCHFVSRSK